MGVLLTKLYIYGLGGFQSRSAEFTHHGKRSHVVVGRSSAHELLNFRQQADAGLVSGFEPRLAQILSNPIESVLFAFKPGLDNPLGNGKKGIAGPHFGVRTRLDLIIDLQPGWSQDVPLFSIDIGQ